MDDDLSFVGTLFLVSFDVWTFIKNLLGVYLFRWNTADYIPDCSEPNYSCDLEFKSSLSLTFGLDFQEKNVVLTLQTLSSQHCFASKVNQKGRKLISWTSLPEASDVACLAWLHYKLLV